MVEPDELLRVIAEQNPWHRPGGSVPPTLARRHERTLGRGLWQRLLADSPHRFEIVLGPRRVGKTTALYQTVRHLIADGDVDPRAVWWLRLDHPLLLQADLGALVRLILERAAEGVGRPLYLMLDEIVYARDWDLWLKTFHDELWPVRIAATSSATAALRERRLESGVGRWNERFLSPCLFSEALGLWEVPTEMATAETLAETLERSPPTISPSRLASLRETFLMVGGFPELLSRLPATPDGLETALLESQQTLRADAVERAIYKDIPQSFDVGDPMKLERLLYVLAANLCGLLAPSRLAKELELSQPTIDRYINYLARAFLVFALTNYSGNESAIQRRGRKLFFVDGAIRNSALQLGLRPIIDVGDRALLIENLVAATLQALSLQGGGRLHHWRDKNEEVDFVVDHPTRPLAIEVGSSATHPRSALQRFVERYPRFANAAWLVAPEAPYLRPRDARSGVGSYPLDAFLVAASRQAERAAERTLAPVPSAAGDTRG